VRAWRFGAPGAAAGLGSREELLEAYGAAGGEDIGAERLRWWEVLGTLKWGIMCIVQARSHLSGASRSVELAAIGRRVCENAWDLLELLTGPCPDPAPSIELLAADTSVPPHGAPGAAGLVEAVREFLEGDVAAATEGRVRFHARVAANALRIVERELAAGPGQADRHRARLTALGAADDRELADAIRAGAFVGRHDELVAALRASVADQLAVANPGYRGESGNRAS
jgi:hypothetical protein